MSKEDAEIQFMLARGVAIRAAAALAKAMGVCAAPRTPIELLNALSRQVMTCDEAERPFWDKFSGLYRSILGLGTLSSASDLRGRAGFLRDPWYSSDEASKLWRAVMRLAKAYENKLWEGAAGVRHRRCDQPGKEVLNGATF